jgi:predicted RNase H-like nuclease
MPLRLAGIDGCRGGWVVARWDGAGRLDLIRVARVEALFDAPDAPAIACVDMPIGLPETGEIGGRSAERAVRPLLGGRQSSVFAVPARAAVMAGMGSGDEKARFSAACAAALAHSSPPRKVSIQCFNLFPKIAELDDLLLRRPELRDRLVECHPEMSFRIMNGAPLDVAKKVKSRPHPPGLDLRIGLLARAGVPIDLLNAKTAAALGAGLDDLVDACACAVTAKRVFEGKALRFPDPPERDAFGLPVAITA